MTLLPLKTLKNPLKIEDKIIVSSKIFDRKCLKIVIYIFAFWKVCNTNITFNVQRKLLKCIYFIGVKFFSLFGQICFWSKKTLAVRWTNPIHNINNEIAISLFSLSIFSCLAQHYVKSVYTTGEPYDMMIALYSSTR